jgi:hypothetical protein
MNDPNRIQATLTRMLRAGPLRNIPQRSADLEILVALGACRFSPGRVYSETEVRERLEPWLSLFVSPEGLDHVTLRRTLVESGFLVRDSAGTTYTVDHRPVEAILPESERNLDPGDLLENLQAERERRKLEWAKPPA